MPPVTHMVLGVLPTDMVLLGMALLVAGAVGGVLAGLFGVGGGTVVVPVLYEAFGWFAVPEGVRMPLCIGTSLAVIVPTSISSFSAHRKRGAVDMGVLHAWGVPIVVGVVAGSIVAHFAPPVVFKLIFTVVALVTAARLICSQRFPTLGSDLPTGAPLVGYGLTIGASASLMGIGGGLVSNMVMSLYGRPIHQAVATSSGVGVLVSLPGALGYIVAGWGSVGLPPCSLGFVSVIGLLLLMPTSLTTAKVGASLAHRLPKQALERWLAIYLVIVSCRFGVSLLP